jgi:hypothetical protein
MYFFAGFLKKNLTRVWWPNSGFSCCVFLALWITLLCYTISMFNGYDGRGNNTINYACWMWYLGECEVKVQIWSVVVAPTFEKGMRGLRKVIKFELPNKATFYKAFKLPNANSICMGNIWRKEACNQHDFGTCSFIFYPYSEPSLDFVLNAPRGEPYILLLWKFCTIEKKWNNNKTKKREEVYVCMHCVCRGSTNPPPFHVSSINHNLCVG